MAAPLGNTNAANAKKWQAAIERALESYPNEPDNSDVSPLIKGLNLAAYKFVKQTMEADNLGYFKEFGDRMDGKPAQTIAGDPENPLTLIGKIERVILENTKD